RAVDRVVGHRLPLRVSDRLPEPRVAPGIPAAHASGDGQLLDELREELPSLCVEGALLVLDGRPLRMAAHDAYRLLMAKVILRGEERHPSEKSVRLQGTATRVVARNPSSAA